MTRKPAEPPDEHAARATALRLLAGRDFSTTELRTRLLRKGVDASTADSLVADLVRTRALDDARFAEHFVSYHAARGHGPVRIRQDLKTHGISEELIQRCLDGLDWNERAREARRRKFGAVAPESFAGKAKQARFLQYRGFTGAQIRAALGSDVDLTDDS